MFEMVLFAGEVKKNIENDEILLFTCSSLNYDKLVLQLFCLIISRLLMTLVTGFLLQSIWLVPNIINHYLSLSCFGMTLLLLTYSLTMASSVWVSIFLFKACSWFIGPIYLAVFRMFISVLTRVVNNMIFWDSYLSF